MSATKTASRVKVTPDQLHALQTIAEGDCDDLTIQSGRHGYVEADVFRSGAPTRIYEVSPSGDWQRLA